MKKKKTFHLGGFTLIELLVVIALTGVIGAILTQIFVLVLRSLAKAEILKEVKQNGDYSLSVMENMIRNATDVSSCGAGTLTQLTIINPDTYTTIFDCSGGKIASISAGFPDPTPTVSQNLTSDKVVVEDCAFRVVCPTPPLQPKYVFVNFLVRQKEGGELPPEKSASMVFQSTISLRVYK